MRLTGILLPIFSLPNSYGIGTLGKEAYQFVDFLNNAKQSYWQVLPIGPTSYGDSPYQSFSSFAGNPYFIDLDTLQEEGLLAKHEYEHLFDESLQIDYGKLYATRYKVLQLAFSRFDLSRLNAFEQENHDWLEDYALFMSIKDHYNGASFLEWDDAFKLREEQTIAKFKKEHLDEINFWKFLQYEFFKQWNALKTYANSKDIKIIGDMPIYTALDSADVWSDPSQFLLDKDLKPVLVAGCPPDYFSPKGQLWGNPIYNYKKMKENGYEWWIRRVELAHQLFDVIRIDHFRGFEAYYAIPFGDEDATGGKWHKGPNTSLFKAINEKLGDIDIIAENLGFITPSVEKMLNILKYPGMKILQFGFDPNGDSDSMPHNLSYNNVAYPGTHDNPPISSWYQTLSDEEKRFVHEYLDFDNPYEIGNKVINATLASVCYLAIIPFYDYLQKGREARINTPSQLGGNWMWRMEKNDMNQDLCRYIARKTVLYRRNK